MIYFQEIIHQYGIKKSIKCQRQSYPAFIKANGKYYPNFNGQGYPSVVASIETN
jgi:hypothetical protein